MLIDVYPLKRLPRSLGPFTYRVPSALLAQQKKIDGAWVRIPFRGKSIDGIAWERRASAPKAVKSISDISEILDVPRLTREQRLLIARFSERYFISPALAFWAMFPERPKILHKTPTALPDTGSHRYTIGRNRQQNILALVRKTPKPGHPVFLSLGPLAERLTFLLSFIGRRHEPKQTLVVVPTNQEGHWIKSFLMKRFGSRVLFLSSEMSRSAFWGTWTAAATQKDGIFISTKVGLLAPFASLGSIFCDLASDPNHKQEDQNPRYDARTLVCDLAEFHRTACFFLDAKPPLSIWNDARIEKSALPEKPSRSSVVDLRQRQTDRTPLLSDEAKALLKNTAGATLVFLNRRGTARSVTCRDCGWSLHCPRCRIPMSPRDVQFLTCHRCNSRVAVPTLCPSCHGARLVSKGYGVERLTETLRTAFPDRRVIAIDKETVQHVHRGDIVVATEKILQIMPGAPFQALMIANLDALLQYPDYRIAERAYLLVERLCAYVGPHVPVLIQTFNPEQSIVRAIVSRSAETFYAEEMTLRKALFLPPVKTVLRVIGNSQTRIALEEESKELAQRFSKVAQKEVRVVGPSIPTPEVSGRRYRRFFTLHVLSDGPLPDTLRTVLTELPASWSVDTEEKSYLR